MCLVLTVLLSFHYGIVCTYLHSTVIPIRTDCVLPSSFNVVAKCGTVRWNRHITPDLCLATSWLHDLIYEYQHLWSFISAIRMDQFDCGLQHVVGIFIVLRLPWSWKFTISQNYFLLIWKRPKYIMFFSLNTTDIKLPSQIELQLAYMYLRYCCFTGRATSYTCMEAWVKQSKLQ
jgi:hypothetical protein